VVFEGVILFDFHNNILTEYMQI